MSIPGLAPTRLTLLGNLHPGVVGAEGVSVPIKRGQVTVAPCPCPRPRSIHRSVLLMAENDGFGGSTFSVGFEALRAGRLLLVALELARATGQAATADTLATDLLRDERHEGRVAPTNPSATDR